MILHPVVFAFIAIFLFFTTKGALDFPNDHGAWLMPVFMIALTIGAFVPEAIKAKNMLISQLSTSHT
ncbi:hypothetical protein [Solilutibacter silvestris]|uniref:hypothetical protein n=1 Tax=Solilutibacter silvestris TaxID=1645665 RepID=UPI003D351C55